MLVSSYSARIVSPFQQGPQDASHETLEVAWRLYSAGGRYAEGLGQASSADVYSVEIAGLR